MVPEIIALELSYHSSLESWNTSLSNTDTPAIEWPVDTSRMMRMLRGRDPV